MARSILTGEPGTTVEGLDLKQVFARILEKEDWTDKLASGVGKILGKILRSHNDTRLSEELRSLVPDMRDVEKAYMEMTSGYKDFIREVWRATCLRQETQIDTSLTDDS